MKRIALVLVAAFFIALSVTAQTVAVGDASAVCGASTTVAVSISGASNLLSLEFSLAYDPARLSVTSVTAGSLTSSFALSSNASGGAVRVAMASGTPVSGSGTVANISFSIAGDATGSVPLTLSNVLVNDNPVSGSSGAIQITCVHPPNAPILIAPANGATGVNPPVVLQWQGVADATTYRVFFGSTLPPPLLTTTIAESQIAQTAPGTTYWWSVEAVNSAGSSSSSTFTFTSAGTACAQPGAPQLSGPAEVTSGTAFELTWTAVSDVTVYVVEEANNPAFAGATSTNVTATRLSLARTASTATALYFRVIGRNTSVPCNLDGPASNVVIVRIVPVPVLVTTTKVIPVVGAAPGNFGSFFRTAVQLHNPTNARVSGRLVFHAQALEGKTSDPSMTYSLAPAETRSFNDLVSAIGLSSTVGSLDLITDAGSAVPLSVVRIYNDGGIAGTAGMTIEPLDADDAVTAGHRGLLLAPIDPSRARMNIGIRTLANGATIVISVRDKAGSSIQSSRRTYPATYFVQVPLSEFTNNAVLLGDEVITFDVESGSTLIYGATTDNVTQDPSIQIARPLP